MIKFPPSLVDYFYKSTLSVSTISNDPSLNVTSSIDPINHLAPCRARVNLDSQPAVDK